MSHLQKKDHPLTKPAPKPFILFTEVIGWLQIFASPFLTGVIIGAVVYFSLNNKTGLIIGGIIAVAGLIAGVIWASRIWKKEGTNRYMSRVISSQEFHNRKKD